MRCLTGVVVESLQQRCDVCARAEREVLSRQRSVVGRLAEVDCLASDGAGRVDLGRDVVLGDSHQPSFSSSGTSRSLGQTTPKTTNTGASSSNTELWESWAMTTYGQYCPISRSAEVLGD